MKVLALLGLIALFAVATVECKSALDKVSTAASATAYLPGFLSDTTSNLYHLAEIRNARFEAAVGIATGAVGSDVTTAFKDVLKRVINWRLLDPAVTDANWKDAIAETFQIPGTPSDPATQPNVDKQAFSLFNFDRSGQTLSNVARSTDPKYAAWYGAPLVAGPKKSSFEKFKGQKEADEARAQGVTDILTTINAADANIRELTGLLARVTECGEGQYQDGRTAKDAPSDKETDAMFQKGCLRWIIRQVHTAMERNNFADAWAKTAPAASHLDFYAYLLVSNGLSLSHYKSQLANVYNVVSGKPTNLIDDPNLKQKGWLTPLTNSKCRSARPNGGSKNNDPASYRLNNGKPVFRFKPTAIAGGKLTANILGSIGLSPFSPRERTFVSRVYYGEPATMDDNKLIKWGVGGNVWMINGDMGTPDDVTMTNRPAKEFLAARADQLMTTAAGPSGTTEEYLQTFDWNGLTDASSKWHLYNGIFGALANMDVYYHHSYLEILNGAGAGFDGKSVVGRAFEYDIKNPFEWLKQAAALKPKTLIELTIPSTGKKPTAVIAASNSATKPITIAAIEGIYNKIVTGSAVETGLLASDYPNDYDDKSTVITKGPHQWTQKAEAGYPVAAQDLSNACQKIAPATVWRFLMCPAAAPAAPSAAAPAAPSAAAPAKAGKF